MKINKILITILLVALAARLLGLGQTLFGDELFYAETAKDQVYVNYYASHPPLSFWLHSIWAFFIGAAAWKSRLLVALFSLANIVLTYTLAKRYAGKNAGLWAAGLLSLSAWFTIGSLQLDMDASFVSFFFLSTIYAYTIWLDTRETKHLILTGILFGLGVLTKYTAVLIGVIIAVHYLITRKPFDKKSIIEYLKNFSIVAIIGFIVFIIPMILLFLQNSHGVTASVTHAISLVTGGNSETGGNIIALGLQLLNALVWIGPLFIGALLYSILFSRNRTNIFLLWAVIVLFFYIFIISDPFRPIEKYLLIIAPALSILGGEFIANVNSQKRNLLVITTSAIVWFFFLIMFNLQKGDTIPFYPKIQYLSEAFSFNFLLNLPLAGHAGPVGFSVLLGTIVFTFLLCAILFITSLFLRKKAAAFACCVMLFFGVAGGYNLYLGEEYLFGAVKPNINHASKEMINNLLESDIKQPLFVFRNIGFDYYIGEKFENKASNVGEVCTTYTRKFTYDHSECIDDAKIFYLDFKDEFDQDIPELINKKEPVVAVIDFPQINKQSILWQTLMGCTITNVFKDKEIIIGYIFNCAEEKHA